SVQPMEHLKYLFHIVYIKSKSVVFYTDPAILCVALCHLSFNVRARNDIATYLDVRYVSFLLKFKAVTDDLFQHLFELVWNDAECVWYTCFNNSLFRLNLVLKSQKNSLHH